MSKEVANDGLLSEKQAAARLGIARISLWRARQANRLKFYRIGTAIRYSPAQLEEFLTTCEHNASERHEPEAE